MTYSADGMPRAKELATPIQFVLYVVNSGLAAATNVAVGFVLYHRLGLSDGAYYAASVGIGYIAGMGVNLALNRSVTFRHSNRAVILQARTFFVVAGFGLILTVALAAIFRVTVAPAMAKLLLRPGVFPGLVTYSSVAQTLAVACVAVYSFLGHKWFTFAEGIRAPLARRFGGASRRTGGMVAGDRTAAPLSLAASKKPD